MTAEPSPRPWRVKESASGTMSCIYAANGEHIASCFGMPTEADAALIVAAVNKHGMPIVELIKAYDVLEAERDRLRDIVKRIEDEVDRCHKRDGQISQELIDAIYEARAIVEEKA